MSRRREAPANTEPYVTVKQVSRNRWTIDLRDGDSWHSGDYDEARTEHSAQRKAERMLARYKRKYGNLSAGFTVQ